MNDAGLAAAGPPALPDKAPSTPSALNVSLLEQVDSPEVDTAWNCRLRKVLIATGAVVAVAGVAVVGTPTTKVLKY